MCYAQSAQVLLSRENRFYSFSPASAFAFPWECAEPFSVALSCRRLYFLCRPSWCLPEEIEVKLVTLFARNVSVLFQMLIEGAFSVEIIAHGAKWSYNYCISTQRD